MARLIKPEDWQPVGVQDLELAAFEVVRSVSHQSVVAGPGAGKTELLAQRACYLLQTRACPFPNRILAISFKRDAAKNLRERVRQRLEPELVSRFDSYTFDAFAKGLLDRFGHALPKVWRPTRDYVVWFPRTSTIPNFLAGLGRPPAEFGTIADVIAISPTTFERDHVVRDPLPMSDLTAVDTSSWVAREFWRSFLFGQEPSRLTFPMIGRLAELLLRANPLIGRALRLTYSHVFLDEFQDTTHVQYGLLHTAFHDSKAVLTAVGDMKQQIMRWAMALPNAFRDFEGDFGATRKTLVRNYRSSAALVRMQHVIACSIDPLCQESSPMVDASNPEDGCGIKEFPSPQSEARYIAALIDQGVRWQNLSPRDFVLLVKQKPEDYRDVLFTALRDRGLKGRDESELQDLLAERLTGLVISFLRLGSASHAGQFWADCTRMTAQLRGVEADDRRAWRVFQRDLARFQGYLHEQMYGLPMSPAQVFTILRIITAYVDRDIIRHAYPEYSQGTWFDRNLEELTEQLSQRISWFGDWTSAINDFEGQDTIPLMTIHKSKGLEYHTVVFVGLDDSAWWSFRSQPEESRSAFFVAFSRAKRRIIFTYCESRGQRRHIASLYEILRAAGVASQYIEA